MLLFLLAYIGGVLTIVSPCILPVLPFVFTRAGQPFVKSVLPLLAGMALTFAGVASLASVGGAWAVSANEYGRYVAMALLALFGLALLWPGLTAFLTQPLAAFGNRLASAPAEGGNAAGRSFVLGIATGFLWAPCAGPILGLVLTGAALEGVNIRSSLLLLSYAAGAATSIAIVLLIGGRVFTALKSSLGAGEWIRRGLGILVLTSVAVIALGVDTGFLTALSLASTTNLEADLVNRVAGAKPSQRTASDAATSAQTPAAKPPLLDGLKGATAWLNSPPLDARALSGKVVLVDFWTYSCINCLRTLPYVRAWAAKYKDHGLVIIGVHSPEFAFEKDLVNVKRAVGELMISYPVAVDSDRAIWRAFDNDSWPSHYLIGADGKLKEASDGEGEYSKTEAAIQKALNEAGNVNVPGGFVDVHGGGAEAAPNFDEMYSPETYIGYGRTQNFMSPGGVAKDMAKEYATPPKLGPDQWALSGSWTVGREHAILAGTSGGISYSFHARDLHLVLGPAEGGKPVRFRVLLDGKKPGADHGADTDADGNGAVTELRLYQLIRQSGTVRDHVFSIEFLDPGVQAFSFTFG